MIVTSASHMVRVSALFRTIGVNVIPAPTDLQIKRESALLQFPSSRGLALYEVAFYGYLGLAW